MDTFCEMMLKASHSSHNGDCLSLNAMIPPLAKRYVQEQMKKLYYKFFFLLKMIENDTC
jgi:hypothetical protein